LVGTKTSRYSSRDKTVMWGPEKKAGAKKRRSKIRGPKIAKGSKKGQVGQIGKKKHRHVGVRDPNRLTTTRNAAGERGG